MILQKEYFGEEVGANVKDDICKKNILVKRLGEM